MKSAGVVIGFVPLIVYGVLAGYPATGPVFALAVATVASVVLGYADLRNGMILSWANLGLFSGLLFGTGVLGMTWIIPYDSVLIYASLAAVTFGSMAVRKPFTLQYARGMVDSSLWDNPHFIRVNMEMAGAWGSVFLFNLLLAGITLLSQGPVAHTAQLLSYGVLLAGCLFTIWYPGYVRKKKTSVS